MREGRAPGFGWQLWRPRRACLSKRSVSYGQARSASGAIGNNKSYGPGHETIAEKFVPVLSTAVADRLWVPLRVRRCSVVRR